MNKTYIQNIINNSRRERSLDIVLSKLSSALNDQASNTSPNLTMWIHQMGAAYFLFQMMVTLSSREDRELHAHD